MYFCPTYVLIYNLPAGFLYQVQRVETWQRVFSWRSISCFLIFCGHLSHIDFKLTQHTWLCTFRTDLVKWGGSYLQCGTGASWRGRCWWRRTCSWPGGAARTSWWRASTTCSRFSTRAGPPAMVGGRQTFWIHSLQVEIFDENIQIRHKDKFVKFIRRRWYDAVFTLHAGSSATDERLHTKFDELNAMSCTHNDVEMSGVSDSLVVFVPSDLWQWFWDTSCLAHQQVRLALKSTSFRI